MAEKGNNVTSDIPKWKIVLAVGAPVAVGLAGYWLYMRRKATVPKARKDSPANSEVAEKTSAPKTKLERAQAAKNKGNKYFKGTKYKEAIDCYTEAICICPDQHKEDIATFYQNRAAAYEQLKNHEQVVKDCTKALECNKKYTKALFRRARACEVTGDPMQCLEDITAVCILEGFQNQHSLVMADRILKELGKSKAKEAYKNRKPVGPSKQFICTYFSAFANDPILSLINSLDNAAGDNKDINKDQSIKEKDRDETPEKEQAGDTSQVKKEDMDAENEKKPSPFNQALVAIQNREYKNIVQLCSQEIGIGNTTRLPEALLLRATFYLLRGEGSKAMDDFDTLLKIDDADKRVRSNALIKRGSLKMQNGDQTDALNDFATAVRADPENSDIYHHRGQLNLLIDRVLDAVRDFEKSVTLSPNFAVAHVQKCYTEYRQAFTTQSQMQMKSAIEGFEETLKKFPTCSEGYALFGQALCDQQQFEEADENFQRALELQPENGNIYVHRGLLQLQWKQDVDESTRLINKALEVDSKCEFAYETLGTIEVQRGNLGRAIELFHKAIELAKTEIEMAHLYSLLDAAIAQSRVAKNFGLPSPLAAMAMV